MWNFGWNVEKELEIKGLGVMRFWIDGNGVYLEGKRWEIFGEGIWFEVLDFYWRE